MISAAVIPRIEGDMDALAEHARAISEFGVAFADTGRRVHATWQGLAAFYRAPEVAQLLAATAPVAHVATAVGEDNEIVGRVLGVYAAEVREIQDRLDALRVQAAAFESSAEHDNFLTDHEALRERNQELLRAVDVAMLDFDEAQRRCANAINALYGGQQYRAPDGDGRHQPGEYSHDAPGLPPPGTSPQQVHAWWNGLTRAQRQSLIETYPERIGALDGVPVEKRDEANQIVLGLATATLLTRREELRGGGPGGRIERSMKRRVIDDQLKGIRTIEARLEDQRGRPDAYLLGLDTDDFGQAIVAVGNPDKADNVVTYVPGLGSNLGGADSGLDKVDAMVASARQVDPGATTAGVVWIGYDAPQSLSEAGQVEYAHHAAGDLDRFQHGLRATHEGPPSHNTVIAHSYGSTVTGVAARDHGLAADATVFVGSPGVRADHARELGLPEGSVWATRADNDVIQHAYDPTDMPKPRPIHPLVPTGVVPNPDPDLTHGNDPTDADFGARRFVSDPGTPILQGPQAAHVEYWDPETMSLRNFGRIIADRPDLVTR